MPILQFDDVGVTSGHSPSAERVLVVIAYRDTDGDPHGINAWLASGADLTLYHQGDDHGQDD